MGAVTQIRASAMVLDDFQILIPAEIQEALGLSAGDRLKFSIHDDGRVSISKIAPENPVEDASLAPFLNSPDSRPQPSPHAQTPCEAAQSETKSESDLQFTRKTSPE